MSLSEISIRRPVFAWMLMAGLIVFGALSFTRMGISQMPDVNFPVVNIALQLDGAAPEVMETDVVDIVEDAVMGIEGLKTVSSSTSQGTANITCEFNMNRNIDVALQEVQSRILQVNNQLPSALYPPVISKTNPEDQPIMWVMVTADDKVPLYQQMIYARNTLKDQLSVIDGVGSVTLAGYVDPNLRVWMNRDSLKKFELTSADIASAIQSEQNEQPAGRIEAPLQEMNVRILGEAKTPADFAQIRINSRGGSINYDPIPLSRVARVEEGISDLRAISRFNGKTAVGLGIVKQHGSNAVKVSESIKKKVATMRQFLLPGYALDIQLDSTQFIRDSVEQLNEALLFAALLTAVVCFLFLGSWSSTFNVLLSIPTSIVGAFTALYFFGFTLNTFTLLGLSLAIGIVVDDAIMMLENIVRHFEMGKSKRKAALDGSNEITFAAIATTLAIAAIFIPVIFMKGVVGAFFYQYGITVTVAVFLSLLEAVTLTPMRSARFLHSAKFQPTWMSRTMDNALEKLSHNYRQALAGCLHHRFAVVAASIVLFAGSLILVSRLPQELIPPQDQGYFLLNLKTPVGTSIEATNQAFKKAEATIRTFPEVTDIYSTLGNYEHNNIVNAGTVYVILKDAKARQKNQTQMMREIREKVQALDPQWAVFTQDLSLTGFSATRGFPVEFTVDGPDFAKVRDFTTQISAKAAQQGFLQDLNIDYQDGMTELQVVPNRIRAAQRGIPIASISQEVQSMIGGEIFSANTEYPKDGHRYYIRIRAEADQTAQIEDLGKLFVRNNRGEVTSIQGSVDVHTVKAPQVITRVNRRRAIPVFANVVDGKSQQDALKSVQELGKSLLPDGYSVKITGSGAAFQEAFDGLIFALLLGVAVAYLILASQFNSFIHPVTILMALPFSLTGALFALSVTHQSLSLFSMIGLILLMGIVKKNSILLVDFTNQRRTEGLTVTDALLEACPVRLRPILMTSIATVAGAIPEALNFGPGAETRIPMAISIIGGVTLSTLLTLFVVPCVYSLFAKLERPDLDDVEEARLAGGQSI